MSATTHQALSRAASDPMVTTSAPGSARPIGSTVPAGASPRPNLLVVVPGVQHLPRIRDSVARPMPQAGPRAHLCGHSRGQYRRGAAPSVIGLLVTRP